MLLLSLQKVRSVLLEFKNKNKNLLVKQDYVVPTNNNNNNNNNNNDTSNNNNNWPSIMQGFKLGFFVCQIRNNNYYSEHVSELIEMGNVVVVIVVITIVIIYCCCYYFKDLICSCCYISLPLIDL